ncbi:MAG: hypothetical protein M1541_00460, partial [Acidobacteria bacterium]|nr:hypothetical protein [Acidobacteriota bacterium]
VTAAPAANVVKIRLHYRALNALEKFRTLAADGASATFTIPPEHISGRWDLVYYFEVLNTSGTGWFEPDPSVATPYYVVAIDKR